MNKISEKFYDIIQANNDHATLKDEIGELFTEKYSAESRNALEAFMYHDGIGVPIDLEKAFELTEKAAFDDHDPLGYYLLGYMCYNEETPDQTTGGPRQKYDWYDAERFYEICAKSDSKWRVPACLWLGDYFMNFARGGDPEIGAEFYESIADINEEAARKLKAYQDSMQD